MSFDRVSILGVGLLGGSLGLAVKAAGSGSTVVGYGHRRQTLDAAVAMGAIDEAAETPAVVVAGADLVVLATPVGLFESLLRQIADHLKPGCVVTDVGSTKRTIVADAAKLLPKTVQFVGSHPMAGSEKRGVEFAKADLFQHALCILTPTADSDESAVSAVDEFWKSLGMRTCRMTPEEHDRRVADISHLPHAVAAALVAMQTDATLALAGKGFVDTTRIAGGDGALWRDILLDNRDNLRDGITALRAQLDDLLAKLDSDPEAAKQWLDAAANRRADWINARLRELNAD